MTHSPTPEPSPATEPATTVTGHSDDLIEFDGAIYDEFNHYGGPARLVFDNGVVLDIEFDRDRDGVWRITVVSGDEHVAHTAGSSDEEDDGWGTDVAVVTGARSVTFGDQTATVRINQ